MKAGDKVVTDSGVTVVAKLQENHQPCKGCYFHVRDWCETLNMARSKRPKCWDEADNNLIFVKSEDNE